jgi:hypothetical protein
MKAGTIYAPLAMRQFNMVAVSLRETTPVAHLVG